MNDKKHIDNPIAKWGHKIEWEKRVKAICKPCWEIKYCPYGPLVEQFPLKRINDYKSCRIFGHDCPVFYVSEPLTETKELRNISRSIPRSVQFRVLKRENQICSECGCSVKDDDIEFDHIIPWSKGGSTDENNIRLLCKKCNRIRGNRFEEKYLVNSIKDHIQEHLPIEFVDVLISVASLVLEFFVKKGTVPTPVDICHIFGRRKVKEEDKLSASLFDDMYTFFQSKQPSDLKINEFTALKYRWGFIDNSIHKIKETSDKYSLEINHLLSIEIGFIQRLGFHIKLNKSDREKWLKK